MWNIELLLLFCGNGTLNPAIMASHEDTDGRKIRKKQLSEFDFSLSVTAVNQAAYFQKS